MLVVFVAVRVFFVVFVVVNAVVVGDDVVPLTSHLLGRFPGRLVPQPSISKAMI